jgi:hypothetical protein
VRAESTQVGRWLWVLVGLPGPDTGGLLRLDATLALLHAARRVRGVELLVVDPGRLLPGSVAAVTLGLADVRVLAARADLPGALAAQRALAATPHAPALAVVAVAVQRPVDAAELAHALGRPLAGVIPTDPRAVRRGLLMPASTMHRVGPCSGCCRPLSYAQVDNHGPITAIDGGATCQLIRSQPSRPVARGDPRTDNVRRSYL